MTAYSRIIALLIISFAVTIFRSSATEPESKLKAEPSYQAACANWTALSGQVTVLAPKYGRAKFLTEAGGGVHTVYVSEVLGACPLLPSPAQLEPHLSEGLQVLIGTGDPPDFRLAPGPEVRQQLFDGRLPLVVTTWRDKTGTLAFEETAFARLLQDDPIVRKGDENAAAFLRLEVKNLTDQAQPADLRISLNGSANSQSRALNPFPYQEPLKVMGTRVLGLDGRWRLAWRAPAEATVVQSQVRGAVPRPVEWIEGLPGNGPQHRPAKAFDKNCYSTWEPTTGTLARPAGLGLQFPSRVWINQVTVQWGGLPPHASALRLEVEDHGQWRAVPYTINGKPAADLANHPELQNTNGQTWTLNCEPTEGSTMRLMVDRMPNAQSPLTIGELNVQYSENYDPRTKQGQWISTAGGSPLLNSIHLRINLPPKATRTLEVAAPFLPGDEREWAWFERQKINKLLRKTADEWRAEFAQGARIQVPESQVQNAFDANLSHMLTTPDIDPTNGLLISKTNVGWYEAIWATMSAEQIVALDERGFHKETERWLEPFLEWQGTVAPPGQPSAQPGFLACADAYAWVKWTNTHGYLLWALCEHYRLSGDKDWLNRALPHILAACDWIERSRALTKTTKEPQPPEWGLMPPGVSGDGNPNCYDSFTDAFTYRGLDAAAGLLEETGHPRAKEIAAARDEYRASIERAWGWATRQMPPLKLKSGETIPFVPRDVYNVFKFANGQIAGNIWLEGGALNLVDAGVFDARGEMAGWLIRLAEDYCLKHGLSTGQPGFLPQVSVYLGRDDLARFLEVYYNLLAEGADRQTYAFSEYHGGVQPFVQTDAAHSRLVRRMLIHETTGTLELLPAIPRAWLRPGCGVCIENAPTHFGPIDLKVEPAANGRRIAVTLHPPARRLVPIRLRLRHPAAVTPQAVLVNRQPWNDWGADWIDLPAGRKALRIEACY